jgi:flagellar biogenesis protein FliO
MGIGPLITALSFALIVTIVVVKVCRSSVVGRRSSVVGRRSSVVGRRSSVVG